MYRSLLAALAGALLAVSAAQAASDPGEAAFSDAHRYTVKIETRIRVPFTGDRAGAVRGAGFLVDRKRQWVVTNAHVAGRSPSRVEVRFHNGASGEAWKLYVDPYLDIAVVALDMELPAEAREAHLDCGSPPAMGHPVGAFGHPWSLSFTGTRGILSGSTSRTRRGTDMLQTDAPINPGNSGGPLISLRNGKVIGVSTAYRARSQNTNFAVPMSDVCDILELLRAGRDPSPPDLPFTLVRDLEETGQVMVARVFPGVSADLLPGDVIREIVGESGAVHSRGQLINGLRGRLPDVTLRVVRDRKDRDVALRIEPQPRITDARGIFVSGLLIAPIPWREVREALPGQPALMVHYVEPGSVADSLRVKSSDVLMGMDGVPVTTLEELQDRLKAIEAAQGRASLQLARAQDLDKGLLDYLVLRLPVEGLRTVGAAE